MDCPRCSGLMVEDHFIDMKDNSGHLWLRGWHCLICGEIVDPTISRHRLIQKSLQNRPAKGIAQEKAGNRERYSFEPLTPWERDDNWGQVTGMG